jgi:FKBP-type peptidyl-prolyl cis-trans isomerase 2
VITITKILQKTQKNQKIVKYKINYRLTTDSGELVDEAKNFEFAIGDNQLSPNLESCITESTTDKLQTLLLSGADIFGMYDEKGIIEVDKATMPENLAVGNGVDFDLPNGDKTLGVIKKITGDKVLVDFNHPLSKCNIAFQFEILSKTTIKTP